MFDDNEYAQLPGWQDVLGLTKQGKFPQARKLIAELVSLHPKHCATLWAAGVASLQAKDVSSALSYWADCSVAEGGTKAMKAMAMNNIGVQLMEKNFYDEAQKALEFAWMLDDTSGIVAGNLAMIYQQAGKDPSGALNLYDESLSKSPDNVAARVNRAMLRVCTGDWLGGWDDYEWRWKMKEFPTQLPNTTKPRWTGERVKHLIWMQEQGLGDQVHMLRFAPLIRERVDKLTLFCSPEIFDLVPYVKGIDASIREFPADNEDWDAYSPMFDACKIFKIEPSNCLNDPYITIDGVASEIKPYPGKLNIGLCWRGRPEHKNDAKRSMPLWMLRPIYNDPDFRCYSLQMGPGSEECLSVPQVRNLPLHSLLHTSHLLKALDFIVTVDTVLVHLAGAIGTKAIALIAHSPDFRWGFNGEITPWYKTVRLARQPVEGDWDGAILAAKKMLWKPKVV